MPHSCKHLQKIFRDINETYFTAHIQVKFLKISTYWFQDKKSTNFLIYVKHIKVCLVH